MLSGKRVQGVVAEVYYIEEGQQEEGLCSQEVEHNTYYALVLNVG